MNFSSHDSVWGSVKNDCRMKAQEGKGWFIISVWKHTLQLGILEAFYFSQLLWQSVWSEETPDNLSASASQQEKDKGVTDDKYGILLTLLNLTSVKTSHYKGWIGRKPQNVFFFPSGNLIWVCGRDRIFFIGCTQFLPLSFSQSKTGHAKLTGLHVHDKEMSSLFWQSAQGIAGKQLCILKKHNLQGEQNRLVA